MSLSHTFLLVNERDIKGASCINAYLRENATIHGKVVLDDNTVQAMVPELTCIPSRNPYLPGERGAGLNYHGVTLFRYEQAEQLLGKLRPLNSSKTKGLEELIVLLAKHPSWGILHLGV